jgi:drug/metabolite transporter, DME family
MGSLLVAAAAVLWGLLGPATRIALAEGLSATEVAFWRALLAAGLFGVHAAATRGLRLARRDVPGVVAFGVFGVAGLLVSFSRAVEAGGAALASVLLYTAPAWVAILSRAVFGERLTARTLLAIAVASVGVAGIAASGGGEVRIGAAAVAWGLASGLAYALYYLFGKRYFPLYPTATLFVWALPVGALVTLPMVDWGARTGTAWAALLFIAAVPTYLAYVLYSAGLRRVEATRASVVATIEPVVAAVGAYLLFGERFSAAGYAFAAVVLAGVLMMVSGGRDPAAEPPHP